ncbi:MAG TPA: glucose 1-dehydrogenase [Pyrinomonadaceae bacterium]|jgi:dihydroanticapsin dehydrogenase|nr:glucose 1-dehydrogenase [Pyrinomonadaceae bacterium]
MNRLKDKVAIVTGGAVGIGRATVELFAEEGAKVVVANPWMPECEELEALFVETDISNEDDCRRVCDEAVRAFGRLDILVNNAAVFILKGLEATVDDWHRSLSVNVVGTAQMSKFASEYMKQFGGGAIVNLGSISSLVAQPEFITYSTTKAAILQMTRNMAMDLAPFNIRVNCVCPGTILTRATEEHMALVGMSKEDFIAAEAPKHLLNRVGDPREVAYPILFLASDEASFITGTHLMVDGGYTAQ